MVRLGTAPPRWVGSVATGVLLYLLFLPIEAGFIAPFAPLPLLWSLRGLGWRAGARQGYLAGLVFFGLLFWWLIPTVGRFGGFGIGPAIPVVALLSLYMAAYLSAWAAGCAWIGPGLVTWRGVIAAACWWTILEWLRSWLFTGLPWGLMAYSLHWWPMMLQPASVVGVFGLGWMVMLVSLLLFKSQAESGSRWGALAVALGIVVGVAGFGYYRIGHLRTLESSSPKAVAAVIQPSIPQDLKWDPQFQASTVRLYRDLTLGIASRVHARYSSAPALFVWPETATPFYFQAQGELQQEVRGIAGEAGGLLLLGSPAFVPGPEGGRTRYRNRAYLLGQEGKVLGWYDKRHLVPFGEYVPLGPLSDMVQRYVESVGDYTAGDSGLPLEEGPFRIGVLICFESIFPWLAREEVRNGANLLAVITNDAWFGHTEAPYQHEAIAVLRAVETGRWTVRAANTGISSIVSSWGQRYKMALLEERAAFYSVVSLNSFKTPFMVWGTGGVIALVVVLMVSCLISLLLTKGQRVKE